MLISPIQMLMVLEHICLLNQPKISRTTFEVNNNGVVQYHNFFKIVAAKLLVFFKILPWIFFSSNPLGLVNQIYPNCHHFSLQKTFNIWRHIEVNYGVLNYLIKPRHYHQCIKKTFYITITSEPIMQLKFSFRCTGSLMKEIILHMRRLKLLMWVSKIL